MGFLVLTLYSQQSPLPVAAVALISLEVGLPETAGLAVARGMTATQDQAILRQHHRRKEIVAVGQLQQVCAAVAVVVALMLRVLLAPIPAAVTAATELHLQ